MKEYAVMLGDLEHTVLLSDEDAKRLGVAAESKVVKPAGVEDKAVKSAESKKS